ncbi:hypothetical protein HO133_001534 [Letharia lupina]|uniref:Uncharacterized protein n=1 Tax=Letharia lupina TaxID=560253 RepID=A0A8H6CF70_9LECA|nr:uncharacterized protein HO133_001534 [Letharia lupina]KAF6222448.1 hypothetical protein HO133_001534 [Letharia lupina]
MVTLSKDNSNDALKVGRLLEAIEFYGAAVHVATTLEEAQVIKLNRSLAKWRTGCFDKATHGGPVTIKMTEAHGHGLFATRDVAARDPPLCEKAF